MDVPNEQPAKSKHSLWQRMLTLLAMLAARVLIWARERQIMSERAEKKSQP
jgi:hypothetical protein